MSSPIHPCQNIPHDPNVPSSHSQKGDCVGSPVRRTTPTRGGSARAEMPEQGARRIAFGSGVTRASPVSGSGRAARGSNTPIYSGYPRRIRARSCSSRTLPSVVRQQPEPAPAGMRSASSDPVLAMGSGSSMAAPRSSEMACSVCAGIWLRYRTSGQQRQMGRRQARER
jgi:hypothetical protein